MSSNFVSRPPPIPLWKLETSKEDDVTSLPKIQTNNQNVPLIVITYEGDPNDEKCECENADSGVEAEVSSEQGLDIPESFASEVQSYVSQHLQGSWARGSSSVSDRFQSSYSPILELDEGSSVDTPRDMVKTGGDIVQPELGPSPPVSQHGSPRGSDFSDLYIADYDTSKPTHIKLELRNDLPCLDKDDDVSVGDNSIKEFLVQYTHDVTTNDNDIIPDSDFTTDTVKSSIEHVKNPRKSAGAHVRFEAPGVDSGDGADLPLSYPGFRSRTAPTRRLLERSHSSLYRGVSSAGRRSACSEWSVASSPEPQQTHKQNKFIRNLSLTMGTSYVLPQACFT